MITRHFYESEEVELALAYAILRGRHVEAAFWCEELVCSEEEDRAWGTLYRTWLEQCLVVVPDWADTWLSTDTNIHEACVELCDACSGGRDVSLPLLMMIPYEPVAANSNLQEFFLAAQAAGAAQDAWWAALQLGSAAAQLPFPLADRLFAYLKTLDLPGPPNFWLGATMCAAVLLQAAAATASTAAEFVRTGEARAPVREIAAWRGLTGRRARRQYAIPRECLLCVSPRGRASSKTSSLPGLYAVHERLLTGEGCSVWNRVLPTSSSDEAVEAFYALAFPDDIPDEWSAADQLQSHGPGTLARSEEPRWTKWANVWLNGAAARFIASRPSSSSYLTSLHPPTAATQHWLQALPASRHDVGIVDALAHTMGKLTMEDE